MPWNDKKLRPKPCLGRQLIKAKNIARIGGDNESTSQRHTEELDDGFDFGALNLRDVDKDKDMNNFLETAAAAAEEYEGVRRDIKLVDTSRNVPKLASKEKKPDCRSNAGESKPDVSKVASELEINAGSTTTKIDTKPSTNRFEDKLNAEFFAPAQSSLHKMATDLPPTLPPKGWKKAARSNKHVKTKRLYPRE